MISFAGYLPEKKVDTNSFAAPSDLPRSLDFIRLTGILAHHEVSEQQGSFELAIEAAKKAISRAKIDPKSLLDSSWKPYVAILALFWGVRFFDSFLASSSQLFFSN